MTSSVYFDTLTDIKRIDALQAEFELEEAKMLEAIYQAQVELFNVQQALAALRKRRYDLRVGKKGQNAA